MNRQGRSHSVTSSVVREVVRIVGSDRAFCHRDEVDPLSEVDDAERTIEAIAVLSPATLEERRKLTNQLGEGRTAVEFIMMTGYLERSDDGAKRARIAMKSAEVAVLEGVDLDERIYAGVEDDLRAAMLPLKLLKSELIKSRMQQSFTYALLD